MIVCSTYSRPFLHLRVQMLLLCSTIFTHISGRQNTFVKKKLSQNYISLFFLATNGWEEAFLTLIERKVHFLPLNSHSSEETQISKDVLTEVEEERKGWAKRKIMWQKQDEYDYTKSSNMTLFILASEHAFAIHII